MKTLKPLGSRIVVRRSAHTLSKGGILLPESAQEKPKSGEVIAVGPGKIDEEGRSIPMHVKLGDRVLFSNFAGTSVDLGQSAEENLLILNEEDVFGIIG